MASPWLLEGCDYSNEILKGHSVSTDSGRIFREGGVVRNNVFRISVWPPRECRESRVDAPPSSWDRGS